MKSVLNSFVSLSLLVLFAISNFSLASDITAAEVHLSSQEIKLIKWVDDREAQILQELKEHVDINTGTHNVEGLNTYRDTLEQDLKDLGFSTSLKASSDIKVLGCSDKRMEFADHLLASRVSSSDPARHKILLNGHLDTVFSKDDEYQSLIIEKDGTLKGPGVGDMKGGIVVLLNALRALHDEGLLNDKNITVFFNTDEEIGSLNSRPYIEEIAKKHDIGFVFEGSSKNLVTRARKGLGQVRIKVTGRESHAGAAHEDGVSANLELAHKIVEIEKLTDYKKKTTVNVGVMSGGEKRNTVPGCAEAYVDLRFPIQDDGEQLKRSIAQIASERSVTSKQFPTLPKTEIWSVLHRPAKDINPIVDDLISQMIGLSNIIGEPIQGTRYSGGGTDGSIAQGVGLPTIDSIGVDTVGAHTSREKSSVQSLMARTKLATIMLARELQK